MMPLSGHYGMDASRNNRGEARERGGGIPEPAH